ncbi:basigin-like [Lineus longissimus]|uniref:basigin-like n=1 Tax=Lineus longissimus TaxID=88925 RepID=UPI002B4CB376
MMFRESLCIKICTLAILVSAIAAQDTVTRISPKPSVTRLFLKPNDKLYLEYHTSSESELRFNAGKTFGDGSPGFRSYFEGGIYKVKLSKSVSIADSGQYICELKNKAARDTMNILVVNITGKNDVLKNELDTVTVGCSVGTLNGYSLMWYRKGKELVNGANGSGKEETVYNISRVDDTITINEATRDNIGQFDCVVFPDKEELPNVNVTGSAFVESTPYINHFDRSKNLVQGDTVKIECKAFAYPIPTITWFRVMDDETEKPLSGAENRTIISAANGIPNAKLEISELVMEDAGTYGCRATNEFNSTSATILVRVKDKYAALWPFLGIVVEVVILCVIIFIYEKKRGKRHEEDDSPDVQKTNSHDHKDDDLRKRNKNIKA